MVTLVVEGQVHAARDAAGQVLQQPFEQVGRAARCGAAADQLLRLARSPSRKRSGSKVHVTSTPSERVPVPCVTARNTCPVISRGRKRRARFASRALHDCPLLFSFAAALYDKSEQYIVRYMCIRSGVD